RIRGGTTSRGAITQLRLRAGVRQGLLGAGYRPDVLSAAGRRRERLRLIARTRKAGCLVGGGRGVADLGYLVPGNAAGRARRPVAVPVVGSPVTASPMIAGWERGIAVRGLRALVGRVGVPRVPVAEVVHGRLLVRRARAVGRLEHLTRLRV